MRRREPEGEGVRGRAIGREVVPGGRWEGREREVETGCEMGNQLSELVAVTGLVEASMGILMSHQRQPIVWQDATDIDQDRDGLRFEIAEPIEP